MLASLARVDTLQRLCNTRRAVEGPDVLVMSTTDVSGSETGAGLANHLELREEEVFQGS